MGQKLHVIPVLRGRELPEPATRRLGPNGLSTPLKHMHHDAVEFPDGQIVLLTLLYGGSGPPFFNCLRRLKQTKKRSLRLVASWICADAIG